MAKTCDACEFLKHPNPKTDLLITDYWSVGLGNNQAYLGRAFITLKSHKPSIGNLDSNEWLDFHQVVKKLETAYRQAFGSEPLNIGCYMNHAFRTEPYNPHVHWHVYPRHSKDHNIDGISFSDPLFGNFYDETREQLVSDEVVEHIAEHIRQYI